MKKTISLIASALALIIAFPLTACIGPGVQDYEYQVADGYKLVRSSAHMIQVVPNDGWRSDDEIIPAKVVEIAWNHEYVIAKQLGMVRRSHEENDTYMVPDVSQVYYWILYAPEGKRYGPFDEAEFQNKLIEFKLTNLTLKDVKDYR